MCMHIIIKVIRIHIEKGLLKYKNWKMKCMHECV
jgi:hypothetical protein